MGGPAWQWEHPEIDFTDRDVVAPHCAAGCELNRPCRLKKRGPAGSVSKDPGMDNTSERPGARAVAETWLAEQGFHQTGGSQAQRDSLTAVIQAERDLSEGEAGRERDEERHYNLQLRDAIAAGRKEADLLHARHANAIIMLRQWGTKETDDAGKRFALDQVLRALTGCPIGEEKVCGDADVTAEYHTMVAIIRDQDGGAWSVGERP